MLIRIGEFSKYGFVTVAALRHYDDIGLLKPARVEAGTGYRYYTAEQLPRLQHIVALKNLGVSLEDIARLLDDGMKADDIRRFFRQRKDEVKDSIAVEQRRLAQLDRLLAQIEGGGGLPRHQVTLKEVPALYVASVRRTLPACTGEYIAPMFQEVVGFVFGGGLKPAGPTMLVYNDAEYIENGADVEAAFPVAGAAKSSGNVRVYEMPALAEAASLTYRGPYEDMGEAYNAVMGWVAENEYRITGPCRELYIVSPADTDDPGQYVSEIQIPVVRG